MEEDSKDFLRIALSQIKSLPSKYDLSIRYLKNKNIGLNIKKKTTQWKTTGLNIKEVFAFTFLYFVSATSIISKNTQFS